MANYKAVTTGELVAIVFEDPSVQGPATHVLIIGVGDYPHLPGGSGDPKTRYDDGMRQLSSPPVSARTFADWVISRFSNPDRELATVELLLGDTNLAYQPPARGEAAVPPSVQATPATLANISNAAAGWKRRGGEDSGNLLVFYFCGHGMSKGQDFALVASDYGGNTNLPLEGLIDIPRFLVGMSDSGVRDQCYFIDACRTSSESLVEAENYGHPLVQKVAALTPELAQCVYYSTLGGAAAHGRRDQPSVYTEALVKALNGAGASNHHGDWRVNTTRLFEAMSHLMRDSADSALPRVQVPQSGSQVTYELHRLAWDPEVPFLLGVDQYEGVMPPPNVNSVTFRQAGNTVASYPVADSPLARPCDWRQRHFETWLTSGPTDLQLDKTGAPPVVSSHYLQPPGMTLRGR